MLALLGLSALTSVAVSFVLGLRLLRLGSKTRQLPELAIGASFLFAGVAGYIATMIGNPETAGLPAAVAYRSMVAGIALISVGVALNYFFVWQVFRPDAGWARAVFWLGSAALMATVGPISGDPVSGAQIGPWTLLGDAVRLCGGAWGACESLRYYGLMRRRLRLGLAEPAVTNRFLLWGVASLSTAAIFLITSTVVRLAVGPADGSVTPGVMLGISLLTLTTATSQWLAFLPPARYTRWVAARAQAAA